MRYLILIDRQYPFDRGETYLENEIAYLARSFDKVIIFPIDIAITQSDQREIKFNNVSVYKLNKLKFSKYKLINICKTFIRNIGDRKLLNRSYFEETYLEMTSNESVSKILKVLSKFNLSNNDEVYLYSYWFYSPCLIVNKIQHELRSLNIKNISVSRAHRFDIYEEERISKTLPFRNRLLEDTDAVLSISLDGQKYLQKKYPRYSDKIGISRLGTFDQGISKRDISGQTIYLLSVSNVIEVKQVKKIAEAIHSMDSDVQKRIHWTHIGAGPLLKNLELFVKSNLSNVKINLLGALPNTEVLSYIRNNSVDLFLNVSLSEGIPVSIMEAISFGIPVIATDVGGTSEIVINNFNGMLLEKNCTPNDIKECVIRYSNYTNEQKIEIRNNARFVWEDLYNADKNYKNFIDQLKNVFAKKVGES